MPTRSEHGGECGRLRQWFGKSPADADALIAAESAETQTVTLYCLDKGTERGDCAGVVADLRSKLQAMHSDQSSLKSHSPQRSLQLLLMVLVDCVSSESDRLSILKDLGSFQTDSDQSPEERQEQMLSVVQTPEGGVGHEAYEEQARSLAEIWAPEDDELLEAAINRPAVVGEILAARLNPESAFSLNIIGHTFDGIADHAFEALLASNTAAYEKDGVIHMLAGLPGALDSWDNDPLMGGGPEEYSLFETLLAHELIEIVLAETTQLEPLPCHIVASTFERCLRDRILHIAVEAFYLDWSAARSREGDEESADQESATSEAAEEEITIAHDEVSAEAYEEATDEEHQRTLSEMFDDEDSAETTAAQEAESAEPAVQAPQKRTLSDLFDDDEDVSPEVVPDSQAADGGEESEGRQQTGSTEKPAGTDESDEEDSGPAILIVDDSSMSRQMVRSVVEKLGFSAVEATNGIEALTQARRRDPVLIVLDIVMPGKGGIDTLQELRADARFSETPIIMLTVESNRESIQKALVAKANDYLVKPVNLRELEKRIKQYVKE